jgi:hypothetical protein
MARGMEGKGFWVKGKQIIDVGGNSHITVLWHSPDTFGLSDGMVKALYAKHRETIGIEGRAREELIKLAAANGWIRIRHYLTPHDYWAVQFDSWNKREKEVVAFIKWAIKKNIWSATDEIRFTGYGDRFYKQYAFAEGGIGLFLNELK